MASVVHGVSKSLTQLSDFHFHTVYLSLNPHLIKEKKFRPVLVYEWLCTICMTGTSHKWSVDIKLNYHSHGSDGKECACNAGDPSLTPGSGRSPGEGEGYPLQYSCLENSMDRGNWQATEQGVAKSWARLSD